MGWLITIMAVGLLVLWVVALGTGGVAAWFLWITFAIAILLIALSLYEMLRVPRARKIT